MTDPIADDSIPPSRPPVFVPSPTSLRIGRVPALAGLLALALSACGRPAPVERAAPSAPAAPQPSPMFIDTTLPVTVQGGWFYVNGERFYVKGVCFFENHSVDGAFRRTPLHELDEEFRAIKALGFNTVRSQLTAEEIALARRHGLMVMQAANHLFFSKEFRDPAEIRNQRDVTRRIAAECGGITNILYWIVDNEPDMPSLFTQGVAAARDFHRQLIADVKAADSRAIVSMASFPLSIALDHSLYDCVSLNLYPFCPNHDIIGYGGYLDWFKRRCAPDRPLMISEYGWQRQEVTPDVAEKTAALLDEQIAAGATGAFFYTWREFGPDSEPSMLWVGLVPNDGKPGDYRNPPTDLARSMARYFEAVIVEPKRNGFYASPLSIEVYGSERTAAMTATVGATTVPLDRAGRFWWHGRLATGETGAVALTVIARDSEGRELTRKSQPLHLGPPPRPVIVRIHRLSGTLQTGDTYQACITAEDDAGTPLAGIRLRLGAVIFPLNPWVAQPSSATTDAEGRCTFTLPLVPSGFLTLAAGPEDRFTRPYSADVDVVTVQPR